MTNLIAPLANMMHTDDKFVDALIHNATNESFTRLPFIDVSYRPIVTISFETTTLTLELSLQISSSMEKRWTLDKLMEPTRG